MFEHLSILIHPGCREQIMQERITIKPTITISVHSEQERGIYQQFYIVISSLTSLEGRLLTVKKAQTTYFNVIHSTKGIWATVIFEGLKKLPLRDYYMNLQNVHMVGRIRSAFFSFHYYFITSCGADWPICPETHVFLKAQSTASSYLYIFFNLILQKAFMPNN